MRARRITAASCLPSASDPQDADFFGVPAWRLKIAGITRHTSVIKRARRARRHGV